MGKEKNFEESIKALKLSDYGEYHALMTARCIYKKGWGLKFTKEDFDSIKHGEVKTLLTQILVKLVTNPINSNRDKSQDVLYAQLVTVTVLPGEVAYVNYTLGDTDKAGKLLLKHTGPDYTPQQFVKLLVAYDNDTSALDFHKKVFQVAGDAVSSIAREIARSQPDFDPNTATITVFLCKDPVCLQSDCKKTMQEHVDAEQDGITTIITEVQTVSEMAENFSKGLNKNAPVPVHISLEYGEKAKSAFNFDKIEETVDRFSKRLAKSREVIQSLMSTHPSTENPLTIDTVYAEATEPLDNAVGLIQKYKLRLETSQDTFLITVPVGHLEKSPESYMMNWLKRIAQESGKFPHRATTGKPAISHTKLSDLFGTLWLVRMLGCLRSHVLDNKKRKCFDYKAEEGLLAIEFSPWFEKKMILLDDISRRYAELIGLADSELGKRGRIVAAIVDAAKIKVQLEQGLEGLDYVKGL